MCSKGMSQVSCVPAGGGQRQFSGASFSFAEPEGSHQAGEMQKEAKPTVCQVFPAGTVQWAGGARGGLSPGEE